MSSFCHVCDMSLTSAAVVLSHYSGKQHRKKALLSSSGLSPSGSGSNPQIICKICNIPCSGQIPYEMHLKSIKHLKKVSASGSVPQIEKKDTSDNDLENIETTTSDSNTEQLGQSSGLSTSKSVTIVCAICNIPCSGQIPYEMHLKSKKHLKKVSASGGVPQIEKNDTSGYDLENIKTTTSDSNTEQLGQSSGLSTSKSVTIVCEICNIPCSGQIPYEMHLKSKKHLKKVSASGGVPQIIENIIPSSNVENSETASSDLNAGHLEKKSVISAAQSILCEVCEITCSGQIPYEMHLLSKKHLKKTSASGASVMNTPYTNDLENIQTAILDSNTDHLENATSQSLTEDRSMLSDRGPRLKSSENSKQTIGRVTSKQDNMKVKKDDSQIKTTSSKSKKPSKPQDPLLTCELCHKNFTNRDQLADHSVSENHNKIKLVYEEIQRGDRTSLYCDLCLVKCSGSQQMISHVKSARHKKRFVEKKARERQEAKRNKQIADMIRSKRKREHHDDFTMVQGVKVTKIDERDFYDDLKESE